VLITRQVTRKTPEYRVPMCDNTIHMPMIMH
jgi:hypothetical protein